MADIPAQDWRGLMARIDVLASTVTDLRADSKSAAERIDELRKFEKEAEKPIAVLKMGGVICLTVLVAMLGGIGWVHSSINTLTATAASKEQEATLKATVEYQGKSLASLQREIRSHPLDRDGAGGGDDSPDVPGLAPRLYRERAGKIGRVSKEEIALVDEKAVGRTEQTFRVGAGVRVIIDGKTARMEDLKPGMYALLLYTRAGLVELIQKTEKPQRPVGPVGPAEEDEG